MAWRGGCDLTMEIVSPSGSVVAVAGCAAQGATISGASLPGTGTYTVKLLPTEQRRREHRQRQAGPDLMATKWRPETRAATRCYHGSAVSASN